MCVTGRRFLLQPRCQGRTSSQRLPTSVKTTHAERSGGVKQVVTDVRGREIDAPVELCAHDKTGPKSSSPRDIDRSLFILACAPTRFSKSCSFGVILHGNH